MIVRWAFHIFAVTVLALLAYGLWLLWVDWARLMTRDVLQWTHAYVSWFEGTELRLLPGRENGEIRRWLVDFRGLIFVVGVILALTFLQWLWGLAAKARAH